MGWLQRAVSEFEYTLRLRLAKVVGKKCAILDKCVPLLRAIVEALSPGYFQP